MLKNKLGILKLVVLILLCAGIRNANAQNAVNKRINEVFDPTGIGVTLLAMFVVFLALTLLYLFFKGLGYFLTREARKAGKLQKATSPNLGQDRLSGEVNAAIVMALYLYGSEMHDQEDPVITMTKVSRTYSPWSSKIYGLRKSPR